jgi:hypothetical protein
MKSFLIACLVLTPVAAAAASPEARYFAVRDRYVAKFAATGDAGKIGDGAFKEHDRAKVKLAKLLRPIVGPVAIKGFPAPGKANLDSLFKGDLGFGLLDGMLYSSADDKTHLIVTTDALFAHWLREHKAWWGPTVANVPRGVAAALKSEAFYTQALMTDAAIFKYVELPVAKPVKARFAFAMLAARSQDIGPRTPDELIASVVQGGRVFVVSAPANVKIDPMPVCQEIWRESERKTAELREAYAASEPRDDRLFEQSVRMEEGGDAAFRRCFAQRAKEQGFFAVLTKQVQALVDGLPSR